MPNPWGNGPERSFGQQSALRGSRRVTVPPLNPFIWLDFDDPETLWQDVAGTTPIADGQIIQRIDNKGSLAETFVHAGSAMTWHENIINGRAVARDVNAGVIAFDAPIVAAGELPGIGMAIACREISPGDVFNDFAIWRGGAGGGEAGFRKINPLFSGVIGDPTSVVNDLGKNSVIDEWVVWSQSFGSNGNMFSLSGGDFFFGPQDPGFNPWTDLGGNGSIELLEMTGEIAQVLWWSGVDFTPQTHYDIHAWMRYKLGTTFPIST